MGFPRDASRAVEVVTAAAGAAAASSSSPSPPTSRPLLLRGKQPRSRHQIPPLRASWANNQRLLRCSDGSAAVPASSPAAAPPSRRLPEEATNDGFERIRAKLMDHLREAVGRIELPTVPGEARRKPAAAAAGQAQDGGDGEQDAHRGDFTSAPAGVDDPSSAAAPPPPSGGEDLPWKLRRRKPAVVASNVRQQHQNPQPAPRSLGPSPAPSPPAKVTSRLRSAAPERREAGLRRRWPKFSVSLTKEEIDEDLYAFTGRRASRRPKKRPRAVQKQLDVRTNPSVHFLVYLPHPPLRGF